MISPQITPEVRCHSRIAWIELEIGHLPTSWCLPKIAKLVYKPHEL